jgi:hypothetical protein
MTFYHIEPHKWLLQLELDRRFYPNEWQLPNRFPRLVAEKFFERLGLILLPHAINGNNNDDSVAGDKNMTDDNHVGSNAPVHEVSRRKRKSSSRFWYKRKR